MAKTEREKLVWPELQRELDAVALQVKRGTIQDATFIEADPGSSKKQHDEISPTEVSGRSDIVETVPRLDAAEIMRLRLRAKSICLCQNPRLELWVVGRLQVHQNRIGTIPKMVV